MRLTNVLIKSAKPEKKAKRLFDGQGLYLEVSPSGGKWWRFKYRIHGKEKRISLGVYPEVSLKDARERRDKARKHLSNGIDPSEQRQSAKTTSAKGAMYNFEAVSHEWYTKQSTNWTKKYAHGVISRLEQKVRVLFL